MKRSWIEVNLGAIKYNLEQIRKKIGKNKILACIKADSYSHGATIVANAIKKKVEFFGVATIKEAIELRVAGIKKPILILGTVLPEEAFAVIKNNLSATVCTISLAKALSKEAKKRKKIAKIHIKVDTGMGRIGIKPEEAIEFIKKVKASSNLFLEGLFSHFPVADTDISFSQKQIKIFKDLTAKLKGRGIEFPFYHLANSAAILNLKNSYFNLVRPGITLCGIYPSLKIKKTVKLKPALSLKSRVVFIKEIGKGGSVSYGRTYRAKKRRTVATLPIGYADGVDRKLSNKGAVLLSGKRCAIIGAICMDQLMVDASDIKNLKIGDEAVLIGRQKEERISVEEIAETINTVPQEIVSRLSSKRLPRIYYG
ncbi:MAG: alanine racemase [Candidatus Omnitrophica bacterium]|nr:alanine racemase [Candidatus Omnitrophota bacterium]